jgi:hypothetical protein
MNYNHLWWAYNRPFAHSEFDSKILHFSTFFIQVNSAETGKMVPNLEREMERHRI